MFLGLGVWVKYHPDLESEREPQIRLTGDHRAALSCLVVPSGWAKGECCLQRNLRPHVDSQESPVSNQRAVSTNLGHTSGLLREPEKSSALLRPQAVVRPLGDIWLDLPLLFKNAGVWAEPTP